MPDAYFPLTEDELLLVAAALLREEGFRRRAAEKIPSLKRRHRPVAELLCRVLDVTHPDDAPHADVYLRQEVA